LKNFRKYEDLRLIFAVHDALVVSYISMKNQLDGYFKKINKIYVKDF
jgi:hypothetical protein